MCIYIYDDMCIYIIFISIYIYAYMSIHFHPCSMHVPCVVHVPTFDWDLGWALLDAFESKTAAMLTSATRSRLISPPPNGPEI